MSTLYQSSKDVPTEVLSARLDQLSDVVSSSRERIDAEFTMRIPAEVDRDADLVMSEAAVRLEALQAECEKLRRDAERYRFLLEALRCEIPHRKGSRGNAPGHGHSVPGIWDEDNGALAGKECAWCKVWNEAVSAMQETTK